MKIKELFEDNRNPTQITLDLISKWRKNSRINVLEDGSIECLAPVFKIENYMLVKGEFPIKINTANSININASNLSSFKNFPEELYSEQDFIYSLFQAAICKKITSLEGCPRKFVGNVNFGYLHNLNFSNVNKFIFEVHGGIDISSNYKGPLLSFLKIKELKFISPLSSDISVNCKKACEIVTKHLEDKDVLACQDELIENGLKEFAKL